MGLTAGFGLGAGLAGIVAQWLPLPTLLPYVLDLAVCTAAGVGMLRSGAGTGTTAAGSMRPATLSRESCWRSCRGALDLRCVGHCVRGPALGGRGRAGRFLHGLLGAAVPAVPGAGFAAERVVAHLSARRRVRRGRSAWSVVAGAALPSRPRRESVGPAVLAAAVFGIGDGLTLIGAPAGTAIDSPAELKLGLDDSAGPIACRIGSGAAKWRSPAARSLRVQAHLHAGAARAIAAAAEPRRRTRGKGTSPQTQADKYPTSSTNSMHGGAARGVPAASGTGTVIGIQMRTHAARPAPGILARRRGGAKRASTGSQGTAPIATLRQAPAFRWYSSERARPHRVIQQATIRPSSQGVPEAPRTSALVRATGPLSGDTVIDLTRALAGPHAGMMMGDLGRPGHQGGDPGHGDDTAAGVRPSSARRMTRRRPTSSPATATRSPSPWT